MWQPPCRAARETDRAGLTQILNTLSSRGRASWLCVSGPARRGSVGRKPQTLGSEDHHQGPVPPQEMLRLCSLLLTLSGLLSLGSGEFCWTFLVGKGREGWEGSPSHPSEATLCILADTCPLADPIPPGPPADPPFPPSPVGGLGHLSTHPCSQPLVPPGLHMGSAVPLTEPVSSRPQFSPRSAPNSRSAPAGTASSQGLAALGARSW